MTVPELYLVGAPKAGTTSVASWLAQHPDVFWSTPKEPFYWAADYPKMRAHYGFDTPEAYERLFASERAAGAAVRGEGSTTYLFSREAVPAIVRDVPTAKFIVCLRDPVDLLVSYHRNQLIALNEDEPDFGAAWRRSLAGRLPATDLLDPKLVDYPMVGQLGAALARLLDHVPPEQVHVVLFTDLAARPHQVWTDLADFVGIDGTVLPAFDAKNRSEKMFRYESLARWTQRPPKPLETPMKVVRQWSRTTSLPGVAAVKRRMWRTAPRPAVDAETCKEVSRHLRADVDLLATLVGRDLSHWAAVGGRAPSDRA